MVKKSLQVELDDTFQLINQTDFPQRAITDSAFCQARQKFSHSAFIELNKVICHSFYQQANLERWNGMRLLGIDCSSTNLPSHDPYKRLLNHFGKSCTHANSPAIRLSQMYDVLNGMTLDTQISPHVGHGERKLAVEHLKTEQVVENDLFLLDRGYPAHWLFAQFKDLKTHYCARVQSNVFPLVDKFAATGELETIIELRLDEHKAYRAKRKGINMSEEPLKVRLIRVELPNNEVEILMTSLLDSERFKHEVFKSLYFLRWPIEEDYKKLKMKLEIENFTGITVEAVLQDIHAKVLTKNIVAIAVFEAQKNHQDVKTKWRHKINFTNALSKFKGHIITLITNAKSSTRLVSLLLADIVKNTYAVRPDRQFKRYQKNNKRRKSGFHMNYKGCK